MCLQKTFCLDVYRQMVRIRMFEERAAELYREVPRARGRERDLAIAACALGSEARLWTLNAADFRDIPGLVVERPR